MVRMTHGNIGTPCLVYVCFSITNEPNCYISSAVAIYSTKIGFLHNLQYRKCCPSLAVLYMAPIHVVYQPQKANH
jgi:hypothetical protein